MSKALAEKKYHEICFAKGEKETYTESQILTGLMMLSQSKCAIALLSLLIGCQSPSAQTAPSSPPNNVSSNRQSNGSLPSASSAPSFHLRYTTASTDHTFSPTGYQNLQLDSGEIILLGRSRMSPRKGGEPTWATLVHKLDAQGRPLWSKSFETGENITLNEMLFHDGALYISGGFRDRETPTPDRNLNINLRDILILKMDLKGNLLWQQRLKPTPFSNTFTNEIKPLAIDAERLGVVYYNRLYVLSTANGTYLNGLDFHGGIQSLARTPDGGFLINHKTRSPNHTWVNSGFQLSSLSKQLQPRWQKEYGADLKGLFTLANLSEVSPGRYHTAMAINEANSSSNSVGIVHLFTNAEGEIQQSFADLSTVNNSRLAYVSIERANWQDGYLFLSTQQTNGKGGLRFSGTIQYRPDGSIVRMRATPVSSTGVYQNRLLLSLSGERLPFAYHFQLAANPVETDLCTPTPSASIDRDEDYQVKVSQDAPAPVNLGTPTVMPVPDLPAVEVSLRSSRADCTGL